MNRYIWEPVGLKKKKNLTTLFIVEILWAFNMLMFSVFLLEGYRIWSVSQTGRNTSYSYGDLAIEFFPQDTYQHCVD